MSDPTKVLINSLIKYGNHFKIAKTKSSEQDLTNIHAEVTNLTEQFLKQLQTDQNPPFPKKTILKIFEKLGDSLQKFKELDPERASAYEDLLNETNKSQKNLASEIRASSSPGVPEQAASSSGDTIQSEGSTSDGPGQQQHKFTQLTELEKKCLFCFCLFPHEKQVKKREPIHSWIGMGLVADSFEGGEILNRLVDEGFIQCTIDNEKLFKKYLMKEQVHHMVVKEMNIEFKEDSPLSLMYQNRKQKQSEQDQLTASQQQQQPQHEDSTTSQQQQPQPKQPTSQLQQPQQDQPTTSHQQQQPQQDQQTTSQQQQPQQEQPRTADLQQQQSSSQQQQYQSPSQHQQQQLELPTTSQKQQQEQVQLSAPQTQQQEPQSPSQQTASKKSLSKRKSFLKPGTITTFFPKNKDAINEDDINVPGSLVLNKCEKTTLQSKDLESIFNQKNKVKVLHLGNWFHDIKTYIVVEVEALNTLTRHMGQVAFLSLQGLSGIVELPDSVYNLGYLKVLDLRGCPNLEYLSNGIQSLKQLTHLDLSKNYLLSHIPSGIDSLTELRVLKGFIVNLEDSNVGNRGRKGRRNTSSGASFSDLKVLTKLKKLSIRTRRGDFPTVDDFDTLRALENLANLSIAWACNYNDVSGVCGSGKFPETLKKLELQATPENTLPRLLKLISDDKENSLQKLYIRGGQFWDLGMEMDCLPHVHTIRLRYLPELHVAWGEFREFYPNLTRLEVSKCPNFSFFPNDEANGVRDWETNY